MINDFNSSNALLVKKISELPIETQATIKSLYRQRRKHRSTWIVLAILGFGFLYLWDFWKRLIFALTVGWIFVWWFYEIFNISHRIKLLNEDLLTNLYTQYKDM